MQKIIYLSVLFLCFSRSYVSAQLTDSVDSKNELLDSLYIQEVEQAKGTDKVLHAEPLYIDLIRDLGARRGEKEWNVGLGMTDRNVYDQYLALVEYEWAPVNRLGLEVELPFTLYYRNSSETPKDSVPNSKLNGLKLAAQYTFLVSEVKSTSLAIGYIHEYISVPFKAYNSERLYAGNLYNPFLVAAKRWGNQFHTLLYTGPQFIQTFTNQAWYFSYDLNANIHYMITGTRNFVGLEINQTYRKNDFDMTLRPQMRVSVAHNLLIGIVTAIPIKRETERMGMFLRIIYEPGHNNIRSH